MSLKRESVLGVLIFCMALMGAVGIQAQGSGTGAANRNNPRATAGDTDDATSVKAQIAALQMKLDQALATVAQLETGLNAEISARLTADTTLRNSIAGSGRGVSQATLDAAIAAEASARAEADSALRESVETLAPLTPLAAIVSVNTGTINDLAGPHVIFNGANVHIRSGDSSGDSLTENGKGNLVLGYNESAGFVPAERGGSHNLVIGPNHRYNFGVGFVSGYQSHLQEDGASVTGGAFNSAGYFSSVSGGRSNLATGMFTSVTGGESNLASGGSAVVSGGVTNRATGDLSSVSGGSSNEASAVGSTVGGGANHTNSLGYTFVP